MCLSFVAKKMTVKLDIHTEKIFVTLGKKHFDIATTMRTEMNFECTDAPEYKNYMAVITEESTPAFFHINLTNLTEFYKWRVTFYGGDDEES